jgi:peroxiredoxin
MINLTNYPKNLHEQEQDEACDHLFNSLIPDISLPTQDNNFLKLNRSDTFRLVIFCYPVTGHPERPLPENWNFIPGAKGCTYLNCSFRDNYENLINANSLPVGVSTQSVHDIKEMTSRLKIPYDIVSDQDLLFSSAINLPISSIGKDKFLKRVTLIVEKTIIKKVFYPIYTPQSHIDEVLDWLNKN